MLRFIFMIGIVLELDLISSEKNLLGFLPIGFPRVKIFVSLVHGYLSMILVLFLLQVNVEIML